MTGGLVTPARGASAPQVWLQEVGIMTHQTTYGARSDRRSGRVSTMTY